MVLPSLRYANGFCAVVKVLNNWHCMQLLAVLLILLGCCTHFEDECLGLFHRLPKILNLLAWGTTKTWEFHAFPAGELVHSGCHVKGVTRWRLLASMCSKHGYCRPTNVIGVACPHLLVPGAGHFRKES